MLVRLLPRLVVLFLLALLPLSAVGMPASQPVAYHPVLTNLGPGATYRWHSGEGGVHVVTVTSGRLDQLRVVVAHDRVDGGRETVASMCRRYHCLAAVNGDFFGPKDHAGGIVLDSRVLRSPNSQHEQLLVQPPGAHRGVRLGWEATLNVGSHHVRMPVNVVEQPPAITLFTSRFAGPPPSYVGSVALWLKRSNPHQPLDVLGSHVPMVAVGFRPLAAVHYVPPGWAVAVGRGVGAKALHDLYLNVQRGRLPRRVSLDWDPIESVQQSLGGHPVMMRDGRGVLDPHDPWNTTSHQRTIVAGGPGGRVWLIVTDHPITNYQAVRMLRHWHAEWAVGLDGGGSATMVLKGRTVNHLQDGAPRPVASALLLVRASAVRRAAPPKPKPRPKPAPHVTTVAHRVPAHPAPPPRGGLRASAVAPVVPPAAPMVEAAQTRNGVPGAAAVGGLAAVLLAGLGLGLWLARRS